MVGSVIIGVLLAFGLVRARIRLGAAANVIMLIPLVTPEIVTGVASLMLFKGVGLQPGLTTLMIAQTTFSISYVTVILRARVAELNPEVEEAAMDLGATRLQARAARDAAADVAGDHVRRRSSSSRSSSTTSCSPSSPAASTRSRCRCASTPRSASASSPRSTPSAPLMLLGSILLIALALLIPRLLGRRGNGLDLFGG